MRICAGLTICYPWDEVCEPNTLLDCIYECHPE